MNVKQKRWYWKLTFPFAHNNYTVIGKTLYHPKGKLPTAGIMRHENLHMQQMHEVGVGWFYFLYLFCFPFLWNPWRYRWEYEAYKEGSGYGDKKIKEKLRSSSYGWMLNDLET